MLSGTDGAVDVAGVKAFFAKHRKVRASSSRRSRAAAGAACGIVTHEGEIAEAFTRASAEAKSAFGNGDLYAERLIAPGAPHRGADRR